MIQWTNKLTASENKDIDVWKNHFKSSGRETEVREFGERYQALFVGTTIVKVPASMLACCERNRVANTCSPDCRYRSLVKGRVKCKARDIVDNMRGE